MYAAKRAYNMLIAPHWSDQHRFLIPFYIHLASAADYDIRGMWKYVKAVDKCIEENPNFDPLKEKKSTMFFLNKYLDRGRK